MGKIIKSPNKSEIQNTICRYFDLLLTSSVKYF